MTITNSQQPQTAEFLRWFATEKAEKGLVDVKFQLGDTSTASTEEIFGEANAMLKAEDLEDTEIF